MLVVAWLGVVSCMFICELLFSKVMGVVIMGVLLFSRLVKMLSCRFVFRVEVTIFWQVFVWY